MAWHFSHFQVQDAGWWLISERCEMPLGSQSVSHSLNTPTGRGSTVVKTSSLGEKALRCKSRGPSSPTRSKPPRQGLGLTLPTHLSQGVPLLAVSGGLNAVPRRQLSSQLTFRTISRLLVHPGIPVRTLSLRKASLRHA